MQVTDEIHRRNVVRNAVGMCIFAAVSGNEQCIMPALHDYYDHISAMQWVVVSICESMLMVVFLSGQDEEKAPYMEVEAKDGEENESKNE